MYIKKSIPIMKKSILIWKIYIPIIHQPFYHYSALTSNLKEKSVNSLWFGDISHKQLDREVMNAKLHPKIFNFCTEVLWKNIYQQDF